MILLAKLPGSKWMYSFLYPDSSLTDTRTDRQFLPTLQVRQSNKPSRSSQNILTNRNSKTIE